MKNRVELINKYIEAEMNERGCSPEQTSTYLRIKSFYGYRNTRVEQAWYAQYTYGQTSGSIASKKTSIDHDRRSDHNLALNGMLGFDLIQKKYNLEPLYTGAKLTEDEIEGHYGYTYDARMEMTDWFLSLLNEIDDLSISRVVREKGGNDFVESLRRQSYAFDSKWDVKEHMKTDEGENSRIIFNDSMANRGTRRDNDGAR